MGTQGNVFHLPRFLSGITSLLNFPKLKGSQKSVDPVHRGDPAPVSRAYRRRSSLACLNTCVSGDPSFYEACDFKELYSVPYSGKRDSDGTRIRAKGRVRPTSVIDSTSSDPTYAEIFNPSTRGFGDSFIGKYNAFIKLKFII